MESHMREHEGNHHGRSHARTWSCVHQSCGGVVVVVVVVVASVCPSSGQTHRTSIPTVVVSLTTHENMYVYIHVHVHVHVYVHGYMDFWVF